MVQQITGLIQVKVGIRARLIDAKGKELKPACVPYSNDFSNAATPTPQNIDLSSAQFKNTIGHVKSIYIDNSGNTASLSVLCAVTRQTITCPAGYQGYFPVASAADQFQISTTGQAVIGIDFFNVDIEPNVWSAIPGNSTIGAVLFAGSDGIDHSVNPAAYPPAGYTLSKTIGDNTSRAKIAVQNQSVDLIQLWRADEAGGNKTMLALNPAGVAGNGGGSWESQTFKGSLEIWTVTGNTDQVACYED